ncbi:hypothetical protein OIE66_29230 [Nonomuraea sp. NBC_01738]|uniref:nSTAND1 domain-containing NTPase n=1 Tax=Nonomuraea sp. NBC_01738 TaxID=2976003 RepID=UPI002E12C0BB|nr:hypothetical protein OIE66_29230 [Nonomuraea sp. NBC_01738]
MLAFRPPDAGLAEPLAGLVARALSRDPAARPTAREVLLELLGLDPAGEGKAGEGTAGEDALLAEGGTLAAPLRGPGEPDLGSIAEELYGELSEQERAAAPEVFLRMVDGDTLRAVSRDELPGAETVDALLGFYAAAGLVVEQDAAYRLAKPALLTAWPRLRTWLEDNRDGLPVHRRLSEAARFWDGHGRKPADLLQGSHLDRTMRWAAAERKDLTLVPVEREFLDAAAGQVRSRSRRRGLLAGTLAVLLVVALGGLGLAEYLRQRSDRQRDEANARALALRADDLRDSDPRMAMLLSAASWRLGPGLPESRAALYDSLSQGSTGSFTDPDVTASTRYALDGAGRTLAAVSGGRVRLWDVREGRERAAFGGVGEAKLVALSPDGSTLAVQDDRGVRLWDTASGTAKGEPFATGADGHNVKGLAFDPTGTLLAVPENDDSGRYAPWWDLATRKKLPHGPDVVSVDHGLGLVYGTGAGRAELWDLRAGKRLPAGWLPAKADVVNAAFGPDGAALAVSQRVLGADAKGSRLWLRAVRSGRALPGDGWGPAGGRMTFGFGGAFLAHTQRGRELAIQRLSDGAVVTLTTVPAEFTEVRFDDGARALRVLAEGGRVLTLDLGPLLDRASVPGRLGGRVQLAPDGRTLALYDGERARLYDAASARPIGEPIEMAGRQSPPAFAFSRDGRRLAVAGAPAQMKPAGAVVVDTATGRVTGRFPVAAKGAQGVDGVALSADGGTLAVAPSVFGPDGFAPAGLELWDVNGATRRPVTGAGGSRAMAFRPDGRMLVAGAAEDVTLVDPAAGRPLAKPGGSGLLTAQPYAFSPDGSMVAAVTSGRLSLWKADFSARIGAAFPGEQEIVLLAWSPDGRTIASYDGRDRVRLWDVASRTPLGTLFDGRSEARFLEDASLAFTADGRTLLNATPEGVIRRFPLDGERLVAQVCARAGRPATAEERARSLRDAASC